MDDKPPCAKIRHATMEGALAHLKNVAEYNARRCRPERAGTLGIYACPECIGYFHIGHSKRRQKGHTQ
jgi:hypothetical protein